jgi:NDP-sugar pyrophosphorylase family protein
MLVEHLCSVFRRTSSTTRMTRVLSDNPKTGIFSCVDADQEDVCAVLLVGGMGTRLRSAVPSTPKPLASLGNRSFLHLLVQQLRSQCIRRLVMCTGYLAEQIEDAFGDGHEWGITIHYSRESHPLGTAGAVKLAERYLSSFSDFLVMNGDSFLELDFQEFIRFHRQCGGLITIAVRKVENAARYGTVQVDKCGRVVGFTEKNGIQAEGLINGGVYAFNRAVLQHISNGPVSLERDIFPRLIEHGVYAFEQLGMFIDIGTPEDYTRAQEQRERLYQAAAIPNSDSQSRNRQSS